MTSRQKQRSSLPKTVGCLVHNFSYFRGFAKLKQFTKSTISMDVGGWVGPDLTRIKKLENRPQKLLRINTFCDSMPVCTLFVCTLFIFSHYDLSVLSMSVMGFQKKSAKRVGAWCELYPVFLELFYIAKS